jgi:hypothetical protein
MARKQRVCRSSADVLQTGLTEADWQSRVIDLARLHGWRVAHFRPARTAQGWRTAVAADGAGFPDLVLVRGSSLLLIELKTDRGTVSSAQRAWLDALAQVPGALVDVWRPGDWPVVQRVLGTAAPTARVAS